MSNRTNKGFGRNPESSIAIGGLVALGLDRTGRYLLAVTHSGRGVFSTETWERVARDKALSYPEDGRCDGIGPIEGESIAVVEGTVDGEDIWIRTPDLEIRGESDLITARRVPDRDA